MVLLTLETLTGIMNLVVIYLNLKLNLRVIKVVNCINSKTYGGP